MIPKLEGDIPELQKQLSEEEKILEEIKENSKGSFCLIMLYKMVHFPLLCKYLTLFSRAFKFDMVVWLSKTFLPV